MNDVLDILLLNLGFLFVAYFISFSKLLHKNVTNPFTSRQ